MMKMETGTMTKITFDPKITAKKTVEAPLAITLFYILFIKLQALMGIEFSEEIIGMISVSAYGTYRGIINYFKNRKEGKE